MADKPSFNPGRFAIFIDGQQIGSFSELQGITTKVDVVEYRGTGSRNLTGQELANVVRQRANGQPVTVHCAGADTDLAFLKKLARRMVKVTAFDERGTAVLAFQGIVSSTDSDVMQQEWSIVYETIQRVL